MNTIVIYGGRFHPFHKGHAGVYNSLVDKFGADSVYVVSSGKQEAGKSPFSFNDKKKMMQMLGVPADKIVQVKSPYIPTEVTDNFDADTTSVVFAISEKDSSRFSFKPKKDGGASYMQPYTEKRAPLSQSGYVLVLPTTTFKVAGRNANSASAVRDMYINADDAHRKQILTALYGNHKLKQLFDKQLTTTVESLIREYNSFINKFRL